MKRVAILSFSVASYAVFFATFLYAIGFVGNVAVPKALDSAPDANVATAVAIDLALLALFALQHSIMARPFFKRWLTKFIPQAAERSVYVLASSVALIALMALWEPIGGVVWSLDSTVARTIMYSLFAFGWLLVLVTTFLINHFDLFGLRQAWRTFRDTPYQPLVFVTPWLYRVVRHPLYVGWLFAFWATPTMTASHLFFASMTTMYILIAIQLEERDLIAMHPEYEQYQAKVPMLIPRILPARKDARDLQHEGR